MSAPLKGIGPAAASLLLAVHDPDNVIFFSDEVYRWLVADGKDVKLKYNPEEYGDLYTKAKALQTKLKVTPIEIEKAAYVIIKENEPPKVAAAKKEPSGKPRGRPKLAEHEKKPKKEVVPGRGRGRPPSGGVAKPKAKAAANGVAGKRGRPAKAKAEVEEADEDEEKEEEAEEDEEEVKTPAPTGGKRKADGTPKRSGKKAKA